MTAAALGDVADFINGFAFKPGDWQSSGHPIIRIQNLTDPTKPFNRTTRDVAKKYYVQPGDLLVSWSASLGVFTWDRAEPGLVNQHIFRVVPNEAKVTSDYLRHMLTDALLNMERHLHGATMKHVNRGEFLATQIPLPPLDEQRRIAAILDQADALRAKRRQALAHLDDLTQSIFQHTFGDPSRWASLWEMGTIGDLAASANYGTSGKAGNSGSWPILRMGNVTDDGRLDLRDLKFIDLEDRDVAKYTVKQGDMLFNRTNSKEKVGKSAVVRTDRPLAVAGYLVRVRFEDSATAEFVSAYLTSRHGLAVRRRLAKAAVNQANINANEMRKIQVAHPPADVKHEFERRILAIDGQRALIHRCLTVEDGLFASLQSRAFRGEL